MKRKLEPKSVTEVEAALQGAPARVRQHEEAMRRQAVIVQNASRLPQYRDPSVPLPPPPPPAPPPPVMVPNNLQGHGARLQQAIHSEAAAIANTFWRRGP
jgi:hypothetical protein